MNPPPLRVNRMVGMGHRGPYDFIHSPVKIGSASDCDIRFDPALDRGVAPVHCQISWNGETWFVLDCGSPEGTWAGGRRLAEATEVEGQTAISLGNGGPGLRLEVLPAPTPVALPSPAPQAPPAEHSSQSSSKTRTLVIASLISLVILLAGALVFQFTRPESERGLQFPPPSGDSALIADGPGGGPIWIPPNSDNPGLGTYQPGDAHDPEHLITWLPNAPSYQQSSYINNMQGQPAGTSAFLGTADKLFQQIMAEEWSFPTEQFLPEPGGGLPPQPAYVPYYTPGDREQMAGMIQQAVTGKPNRSVAPAQGSTSGTRQPAMRLAELLRDGDATGGAIPKLWAVIVGIDNYEHINNIVGCKNDAAGVAKVLMLHGMLHPSRTYLMTEQMDGKYFPTGANLQAALQDVLTSAEPQDMVLFYFSGHGGLDEQSNDVTFTGVDFTFNDAQGTGVSGRTLQRLVSESKASKILMVFDACHAGGLAPLGRAPRSFRSGFPENFTNELAKGRGHVVIRASGKDEFSYGNPQLGHGVFTFVFLAGLTGAADANRDGIVTLNELRPYVTRETPALAQKLGHEPFHPSFTSAGQAGESGEIPLTVVAPNVGPQN